MDDHDAQGSRRSRPGSGRGPGPAVRPNLRRQVFWVALVVGSLAVGYGLGRVLLLGDDDPEPVRKPLAPRAAAPWYKSQPPPPALVDAPNPPLLPENEPASAPSPASRRATPAPLAATPEMGAVRAYEEALPAEIHLPTPDPPPRRPTALTPPASGQAAERDAWRRNALAVAEPSEGKPLIAIVIDDMGVDRRRGDRLVAMRGPLTLSFLTYAPDLGQQTRHAAAEGHELLLHVGMEPSGAHVDPGPDALLTGLDPAAVRDRLGRALDRVDRVVGINNHMGSRFTENRAGMTAVMEELSRRGLLFLDSRTSPRSVGADVAHHAGVPVVERNIFLDNENTVEAVRARLAETERVARAHGHAIAIGHPRDGTIEALEGWIADAGRRGYTLVPLTVIVKRTLKRQT